MISAIGNTLVAIAVLVAFVLFYVGFILAPLIVVVLGYAVFAYGGR